MEFHDVLHGRIVIDQAELKDLVEDLLGSAELQRLRNMRQMNFDVPLIQELGRSRRFPHSVGVAHIAIKLALKAGLPLVKIKELTAAALLHDAAIPPYGHLVETEFKQHDGSNFDHAKILESFIFGTSTDDRQSYKEILPGRSGGELYQILEKHGVSADEVFKLVAPSGDGVSPIAADVDIDNIDNVHRMAVLLGWDNVRENLKNLLDATTLDGLKGLRFTNEAQGPLKQWLDFRERIYTLIIAHSECIPQNAFQSDLVKQAVQSGVISRENWFMSEPEFEESLRNNPSTKKLADQILSGCQYMFVDYVWIKNLGMHEKLSNSIVRKKLSIPAEFDAVNLDYFIWYERGLVSREIIWKSENGTKQKLGVNSSSCMIAVVKKTYGGLGKITKAARRKWRHRVVEEFEKISGTKEFDLAFPEDYSGSYFDKERKEFELK